MKIRLLLLYLGLLLKLIYYSLNSLHILLFIQVNPMIESQSYWQNLCNL